MINVTVVRYNIGDVIILIIYVFFPELRNYAGLGIPDPRQVSCTSHQEVIHFETPVFFLYDPHSDYDSVFPGFIKGYSETHRTHYIRYLRFFKLISSSILFL